MKSSYLAKITSFSLCLCICGCGTKANINGSWYQNYPAERQLRAAEGKLSPAEKAIEQIADRTKDMPSLIISDERHGRFIGAPINLEKAGEGSYVIAADGKDTILRMTLGPPNYRSGWRMNLNQEGQLIIEAATGKIILDRK